MKNIKLPSLSYHLWQPCNMRCKYCYGQFKDVQSSILPKGHLKKEDSLELLKQFKNFGFKKITFAGGEPTLCPWLPDLVKYAKALGLTTNIVTNGFVLTKNYLDLFEDSLDWVTLSIDSLSEEKLFLIGRTVNGRIITLNEYIERAFLIKEKNIRLKINTVISKLNWEENFSNFILRINPDRWKLLQVLRVEGQNTPQISSFEISSEKFDHFCNNHSFLRSNLNINVVNESNELMKGSYVLIDPAGRFFDNVTNSYSYSDRILEVGIENAYNQIAINQNNFYDREGLYNWERFDISKSKPFS